MSTERIQEDRIGLIESYRNAQTDEQKAEIRDRLMATLNDREKAFFMDAQAMAGRIAHIDRTQKALEKKRNETVGIAQVLGFPIGENVKAGNYNVLLTDTVNKLDSDELTAQYESNDNIKIVVDAVIIAKRNAIQIDTLTATDLKAEFKKKEVAAKTATLTFDLAGGTLNNRTGTYTITAKVGDTIKLPAAPQRTGYDFKCWKGSEYAAGADYKVEGDHAFTAEWDKAKYTVAFDANGGTGKMDPIVGESGSKVTL